MSRIYMTKKILLLGNFSGSNAGDTIVLDNILQKINTLFLKTVVYIPTMNTDFIVSRYSNTNLNIEVIPINISIKRFSVRFFGFPTIRLLPKVDYIFTTAGTMFERNFFKVYYNFVLTIFPLILISKLFKVTIIGFNIGITSPKSSIGSYFLKKTIKMHNYIFARDSNSFVIAKKYAKTSVILETSDVALKLGEIKLCEKFNKFGVNITSYLNSLSGNKSGIVSKEAVFNEIERFTEYLQTFEKDTQVAINIYINSKGDEEISKELHDILSKRYNSFLIDLTILSENEIYESFEGIDFLIGMRMHSLILSISNLIPLIAINYDNKVRYFMEQLNLDDFVIDFDEINKEKFIEMYQKIKNYSRIKHNISDRIRFLIDRREKAYEVIMDKSNNYEK